MFAPWESPTLPEFLASLTREPEFVPDCYRPLGTARFELRFPCQFRLSITWGPRSHCEPEPLDPWIDELWTLLHSMPRTRPAVAMTEAEVTAHLLTFQRWTADSWPRGTPASVEIALLIETGISGEPWGWVGVRELQEIVELLRHQAPSENYLANVEINLTMGINRIRRRENDPETASFLDQIGVVSTDEARVREYLGHGILSANEAREALGLEDSTPLSTDPLDDPPPVA